MARELWLIRHGESTANAGAASKDASSAPLTDTGWQQAHQIAATFERAPELIVVSPYLRARQTAAPTAERFAAVPIETWPVQEFTYLSPIRCANTTMEQRRPLVEAYWDLADPERIDGPGAESFTQMLERVRAAARHIEALDLDRIVIFTHGHIMQAWRMLAEHPEASDRSDMKRYFSAFLGCPIENGEWMSANAFARVARS